MRADVGFTETDVVLVRQAVRKWAAELGFGLKVGRRALANGLLCRFDPHWLAFGPALIVTEEQIDEMVALLDRSIGEVLATLE